MSYKGSCDQNMMWGRGMCVFNGALAVVELEPNFIESPDKNFFFFIINELIEINHRITFRFFHRIIDF